MLLCTMYTIIYDDHILIMYYLKYSIQFGVNLMFILMKLNNVKLSKICTKNVENFLHINIVKTYQNLPSILCYISMFLLQI